MKVHTSQALATRAHAMGFDAVESGPFVRSSYRAERAAGIMLKTSRNPQSCRGE